MHGSCLTARFAIHSWKLNVRTQIVERECLSILRASICALRKDKDPGIKLSLVRDQRPVHPACGPGAPHAALACGDFELLWVLRSDEDSLGKFQFRKIPRVSLWIERHKTIRVHHGM